MSALRVVGDLRSWLRVGRSEHGARCGGRIGRAPWSGGRAPRAACRGGRAGHLQCRDQHGFTVLELLVGCLVGMLVVAAGVELLRVHVAVARRLQAQLTSTGGASWALAIAARDAQVTGSDPARAGIAAVSTASRDRLVLGADRDGDGAVDPATAERVTLAWSSTSGGRFVRWLGNQSISIASTVRNGGLRLRYLDQAGVELPVDGAGAVAAADRDRVRLVALELDVLERAGVVESRAELRTAAALRMRLDGR